MSAQRREEIMSVIISGSIATIRRQGSSAVIVANVLGCERSQREETVYIDRLVHDDSQNWGEWSAGGAISTIFQRTLPRGPVPMS